MSLALIGGSTRAYGSDAQSSSEDRRRFVSVTRSLERTPLAPGLKADREWALEWLVEAPDVTVTVCPGALGNLLQSKYSYAAEVLLQNSFAMAAFVIEHPELASDPHAQQIAGIEGALNAYRSILRDKPEAKSQALEGLLQMQARGQLAAFARKVWTRCLKEK